MKKLGIGLVVVLLLLVGIYQLAGDRIAMRAMSRIIENNLAGDAFAELEDGLHVYLCGAGSPLPDPGRSGPCAAVVAGQQLYIVDVGSGSPRRLPLGGLPPGRVTALLLTHFHSDHIDSLGELAMQRWAGGSNEQPMPVYGGRGVEKIVDGFNLAYSQDFVYRIEHHGPETVIPSGKGSVARPFDVPPNGEGKVIIEQDGLVVTALRVEHAPIEPAVAYRFDYKGRSVLISGDTSKSANLQQFAKGVDLLVHEALAPHLVALMTEGAAKAGAKAMEKITVDILNYHTTPVEAAEIARDAGVGHLLYYHIVPALPIKALEKAFLRGVSDVFDNVTVGVDGTMVHLPAGSDEIDVTTASAI